MGSIQHPFSLLVDKARESISAAAAAKQKEEVDQTSNPSRGVEGEPDVSSPLVAPKNSDSSPTRNDESQQTPSVVSESPDPQKHVSPGSKQSKSRVEKSGETANNATTLSHQPGMFCCTVHVPENAS